MGPSDSIGQLFVAIGADLTGLQKGIGPGGQADKDLEGFTSRVNAGLLKVGAVFAAAGAGIAAMAVAAYQHTEELGQSAYDLGEKFGLSGGEASKWLAIGGELGISSESIGLGFKLLGKNMGDIGLALANGQKPTKQLTESFDELGVSLYDSKGHLRDTNDVMMQVADAFAKMPDGAAKTAAAMKIFGRSGADLIPLLNEGSSGLKAMTDQGIKLGTVMTTQQVEAAHKAYLAHQQFNQALAGVTAQIGLKLMPIATQFFNFAITTAIPAIEKFTGWVQTLNPEFQKAGDILKTIYPYLIDVGAAWVAWNVALAVTKALQWASMAAQFVQGLILIATRAGFATTAMSLFDLAMDANPIGLVIVAVAALAAGFIYLYNHSQPFRSFVNGLWADMKNFGSWLSTHFGPGMAAIGKLIGDVAGGNYGAIPGDVGTIKHVMGFATGGIVPGPLGAPMFAVVHGGERVLTPAQQRAGGGSSPDVVAAIRDLIAVVSTPPGGQTGVEAALWKANQLAGMNRLRGMSGA